MPEANSMPAPAVRKRIRKRARLYRIWAGMKTRCGNPTEAAKFRNYGGRGITVCLEWRNSFESFRCWAMTNGYADNLTLERKDVNGHYEPSNCCWIPEADQHENTRSTIRLTVHGETKSAARWARDPRCTVTADGIRYRINVLGWDHESAVLTPATRAHR